MKTLVKIVCATMLTGCLNFNLYAQQALVDSLYYVKFEQNSPVQVGTSSWLCGDDYHGLFFSIDGKNFPYDGYGKSSNFFPVSVTYTLSSMPKTITLQAKAGDERSNNDEDIYTWNYWKGDSPVNIILHPSQTRGAGCKRSLYANYKAIVDDPVFITHKLSKTNSNTFATATEKLSLKVGEFYENGMQQKPMLQVSDDNKNTWKNLRNVHSNETISLSYESLIGIAGVQFEDWLGKGLYFRVVKKLLNGTETYGNTTDPAVTFYPNGIQFEITSTRQVYCKDSVILTAHVANKDDARYMSLYETDFHWVMVRTRDTALTDIHDCEMTSLGNNKFQVTPKLETPDGKPRESPFIAEEEIDWLLQLQESSKQDQFYCVRKFTIPAKPKEITVEQMKEGYEINGKKYHTPHRNSRFAMLKIDDPSYDSHHRLPYTVILEDGTKISVPELGVSDFEELTPAQQEEWKSNFEKEYEEKYRIDTTARLNFAKAQWGLVLPEKVERIAMPKDGSFFLYIQKDKTGAYRLYKATYTSGIAITDTLLVPSENVIDVEVTPDGAYCVYKKYNTAGLFLLPLTGAIPSSGTLLSGKAHATTAITFGTEPSNHIYKTASEGWAFVSTYNNNAYSIAIPGGGERFLYMLISGSPPVCVSENGFAFYERPLSPSNYMYQIFKTNMPDGIASSFYNYDDRQITCRYKFYQNVRTCSYSDHFTGEDCRYSTPWPQYPDGTLYANEYSSDEQFFCDPCTFTTYSGQYTYPQSGIEKNLYKKECDISRYNQTRTLLSVAPDGSVVIILIKEPLLTWQPDGSMLPSTSEWKTYSYKISSSGYITTIPPGSNFKISPNNDILFSYDNNTYKNNTAAGNMLIQNQKSSNICFSGTGRYFLFIEPITGYVYKQYMSDNDALEDTKELFRESQWKQFLNQNLGTRVSSNHIPFDTTQIWTLVDADGCVYKKFPVRITAPLDPTMTSMVKNPSSICAHDGAATITYLGGGVPPYLYDSKVLRKIGDKITVTGLGYGDNIIQFTDTLGRISYALNVQIGSAVGITDATTVTAHQTCDSPNGSIRIVLGGFPDGEEKTYRLTHTAYPSQPRTYTTKENSYMFDSLPAGMYRASVSQVECYFGKEKEYEVESHIFKIADIAVMPATTLEGKGSATVTFEHLGEGATWTDGDYLFNSSSIEKDTVTIGGITPGKHKFSVENKTGCMIHDSLNIEKPVYWGEIKLNYTRDSLRVFTDNLVGNDLFAPYQFRIINSNGEIITDTDDKKQNVVIRQPGSYALYARHTQGGDSSLVHTFAFPVDSIRAKVEVAPPVCPQDMGTVTVSVQGGGFGKTSAVKVSMDRLNYDRPQKFNLSASAYNAQLRDTLVTPIKNSELEIHAVLSQPLSFVVPAMEPVSAQVDYEAPACAGVADGKILLSNFTGGSGDYEYKINDNPSWQDTTVAITGLGPGTYSVYLRDKTHQCEAEHLYDVRLRAPDTLKVNIVSVKQPTCELDNGNLVAAARGGDGYYQYKWFHNNTPLGETEHDTIPGISFGDTLQSGFYKLQIYDGNQCEASDTATLRAYHNPRVETVSVTDASCTGAIDGAVELLTASGTAPVDSMVLKHVYLPYEYRNRWGEAFNGLDTGKYTLTLRDTAGCYATTPYSLFIDEPEALRIAVDTILPVVEKGARSGKIIFKIHGGNAGHKTVWLKQADGAAIDSLTYINNVVPLSFTQYAGLYRIEAADSKGCRAATGDLQIEEPAAQLQLVVKEVKDARCKSQVGSITVEGRGGWGGYRYKCEQETNFTTLNTFDNLYSGSYVITVIDKLGATRSETVMVHEPKDSLKAEVVSRVLPTCGNNGAFSVQLSGGTPPYKFYDNADTTFFDQPQTIAWTGKGSGNYVLHLVDNNGCRFELEENLPETALLAIEKMEVKHPVLPAASDGEIKVTVRGGTGPYTYQWTQDVTTVLALHSPVLTDIPAGYYGIKVTDAEGCTVREEVLLTDPSYVPFTLLKLGHETSFEATNGYAVLFADVPLSDYQLITPLNTKIRYASSDVTEGFRVQNDTVYLHGLSGGKWLLAGTNPTGQLVLSEFFINVYTKFIVNNIVVSHVRKKGTADGQARIDVQGGGGGNRYSWTTSVGTSVPSVDDEHSSVLRGAPAGSYTVKVEDCYGNILSKDIVIEEPEQALTLSVSDYQNQSCKTMQNAYVVLSAAGGWGDYQFRHQSESYFSNGATYRNLETAGHYFYVTDRQGIVDSIFVDITEPEYVSVSAATVTPAKCKNAFDGSVLFTINGGTTPYSLSLLDSGEWAAGNVYNGLQAGLHTFIFRDKNECMGQDTITVYVSDPDSLLFENIKVTHTTCGEDNGKIAVGMQGGTAPYQYQWTNSGNTIVGNGAEISGLSQNGTYRLKAIDSNGCIQQLEQLIHPSTAPVIATPQTTPVLCYGDTTGTAQVVVTPAEPSAPYSLVWSNGARDVFSSRFYKGTHHVTVTDTNGCAVTRYFDITQPDSLQLFATEVREPHCYGYSDGRILTGALGGVPAYTYQWSNGATAPNVENLTKGAYSVTVTDANGCAVQTSFTLEEPEAQTVDLGEDVVICPGNTHRLDGKNYVLYRWYTAAGDVSNERYLNVSEAGRYFLEATDARGCPALGEVNVAIGHNALKADFLLASEAALGDTIMIFELSNMALDSLRWEYDHTAFERIFWNSDYDYSYVLSLHSLQTGRYDIDLYAYSGGCYSRAVKSIDIGGQRPVVAVPGMIAAAPLITSVKLYPNPNRAVFTVEIQLRETSDVRLMLFSVVPGARLDERTERGSDYYHLSYNLPQLTAGMYVLVVTAGNERQVVKLIVAQ